MVIHWARRYDLLVQAMTLGRAGQLRRRMADLLPLQAGDAVLDIGCGSGDLTLRLARRVGATGTVVGIDPSAEMIARARRKALRRGLALEFRLESAATLDFPPATFDVAVSSLVFHHLPAELRRQALTACARVLKGAGSLVIIDFLGAGGQLLSHGAQPTDPRALPALLSEAGFTVTRSSAIPFRGLGMPSLGYVIATRTAS
jgi:ubiquinone/menaquinone biosynthesis C-methylase UbiE